VRPDSSAAFASAWRRRATVATDLLVRLISRCVALHAKSVEPQPRQAKTAPHLRGRLYFTLLYLLARDLPPRTQRLHASCTARAPAASPKVYTTGHHNHVAVPTMCHATANIYVAVLRRTVHHTPSAGAELLARCIMFDQSTRKRPTCTLASEEAKEWLGIRILCLVDGLQHDRNPLLEGHRPRLLPGE
jgi:hypothetical protein